MYCPKCRRLTKCHEKEMEKTATKISNWVICDECGTYLSIKSYNKFEEDRYPMSYI